VKTRGRSTAVEQNVHKGPVAFAALVLATLGFGFKPTPYDLILMGCVTVLTLSSVALYLVEWVRHMNTIEPK
jgi:cardiolipin synthase (CMP-forming)